MSKALKKPLAHPMEDGTSSPPMKGAFDFSLQQALLQTHLDCLVPLCIYAIKEREGPDESDWEWAEGYGRLLAEHGDDLMFQGKHTSEVAGKLPRAVAILSFSPGGVTIFGRHFDAADYPLTPGETSGASK